MWGRASSAEHASARYTERRRLRRRRIAIGVGIFIFILLGALGYALWQSPARIARVTVYGANQSLASFASTTMQGSYFGIVPRDSTFFFPATRIRSDIIAAYPDIAAVSIFRNGLTGLSVKVDYRVPVARWCPSIPSGQATSDVPRFDLGTSSPRSNLGEGCYVFDANGFVYATTSMTVPINSFVVYEPLQNNGSQTSLIPVGSVLPNADRFPAAFDFARQLTAFGSPVVSIAFRSDEVDDTLKSGTRLTYILGDEQNAFTALASARANFSLADGSLDYVDLRFPGKVYLKKLPK